MLSLKQLFEQERRQPLLEALSKVKTIQHLIDTIDRELSVYVVAGNSYLRDLTRTESSIALKALWLVRESNNVIVVDVGAVAPVPSQDVKNDLQKQDAPKLVISSLVSAGGALLGGFAGGAISSIALITSVSPIVGSVVGAASGGALSSYLINKKSTRRRNYVEKKPNEPELVITVDRSAVADRIAAIYALVDEIVEKWGAPPAPPPEREFAEAYPEVLRLLHMFVEAARQTDLKFVEVVGTQQTASVLRGLGYEFDHTAPPEQLSTLTEDVVRKYEIYYEEDVATCQVISPPILKGDRVILRGKLVCPRKPLKSS